MPRFSRTSFGLSIGALALLLCLWLGGALQAAHAQQGPADTTRVSFDEAVRIALDQNTQIKRAQASARQSSAQVQAEWMDFFPDLSFSGSVSRNYGRNFSQEQLGFVTEPTDYMNSNARSSVTLFNGFENSASLDQAQHQSRANELQVRRTRREVVSTVMDQYISLVQNREIVRVRREQVEAQRQRVRQIQEFVDAGSRPVSDLYTAQADLADAEQQVLQAKRDREVSRTRLIQTLQLNPRKPYEFAVPDLKGDTLRAVDYDMSNLIDEAFENRLDLQAAQMERRAAEQGVRVARSSYYPTLSISGSYGTRWTGQPRALPVEGTSEPPKFAELEPINGGEPVRFPIPGTGGSERRQPGFSEQLDNNRSGSISLSLSIPIFQGLQRDVQVEQAQVQAQNAQYALEDQRQTVALEVRQAYLDYQNAVQQLEAASKRLRAARQARTAAEERYELGSADIVELQNAIRDYVDAASQHVRAQYNLIYQQERIQYTVGRLDPEAPVLRSQSDASGGS